MQISGHMFRFYRSYLRVCRCVWMLVRRSRTAQRAERWGRSSGSCQRPRCADTEPRTLIWNHRSQSGTSGRNVPTGRVGSLRCPAGKTGWWIKTKECVFLEQCSGTDCVHGPRDCEDPRESQKLLVLHTSDLKFTSYSFDSKGPTWSNVPGVWCVRVSQSLAR